MTARKLLIARSGVFGTVNLTGGYSIGIRVWKRSSVGAETEITGGVPVAVADYVSDGVHSATCYCPQTALTGTDAVVVRVYLLAYSWVLKATFLTEQLGASQLDAATWILHYYLVQTIDPETWVVTLFFYFDTTTYNSRTENFMWSTGASGAAPQVSGDGLVWFLE